MKLQRKNGQLLDVVDLDSLKQLMHLLSRYRPGIGEDLVAKRHNQSLVALGTPFEFAPQSRKIPQ
jgi:hypothetical protein